VAPSPEELKKQLSQKKRILSVRVTEKEFQALLAYAEKRGKNQTQVVRALIRKLPTYDPTPKNPLYWFRSQLLRHCL
jgi:hypothetical protein